MLGKVGDGIDKGLCELLHVCSVCVCVCFPLMSFSEYPSNIQVIWVLLV